MATDRTTVNVSKDAHAAAKADKRDDESWSDWFERKAQANTGSDGVEMNIDHDAAEDIQAELEKREVTQDDINSLMESLEAHDDAVVSGIDRIISKIDNQTITVEAAQIDDLASGIAEELR